MTPSRSSQLVITVAVAVLAVATVAAAVVYLIGLRRPAGLPAPGTDAYEQTTRRFHRGLAEMEVGLLEGAIDAFTRATETASGEPASWANLGLTHLRLGAFDEAAPAIERAAALAPDHAGVAFLQGRLETMRGRRDEGIAHLRRAVDLDAENLQALTALIQEIENAGGADADAEAQRLLELLLERQPDNPAVVVERARLAAKRGDAPLLQDSIARLEPFTNGWPPEVLEQYQAVRDAVAAGNTADAARAIAFLRNVLASVPEFLESRRLVTPSAELVANPFTRFIRLPAPVATPSPADMALTYTAEVVGQPRETPWLALEAISLDGDTPPVLFAADAAGIQRVDLLATALPFPGDAAATASLGHGLVAADWNHDFRLDLAAAGPGGVRMFLQAPDGTFADDTARAAGRAAASVTDATGIWAADVEMDGDIDLVVGQRDRDPLVLQNDGLGQWQPTTPFAGVSGLRAFAWGDVDNDGDPDAVMVDDRGTLHVLVNLQGGRFQRAAPPTGSTAVAALAIADADADGHLDIVTIDTAGTIRRASMTGNAWSEGELARWTGMPAGDAPRLFVADLDNNGALDVIASSGAETAVWLGGEDLSFTRLAAPIDAATWAVADLDGDGALDLAGLSAGRPVRLTARPTRGYHFQVVRPRAQTAAGDQRINTFGIGGIVETRAGLLVQKQTIAGPTVHVGLGNQSTVDVVRIVWPNGVPQADFESAVDGPVVAEQRLKGSCPWIFAFDGTSMRFVTDFLWRSPLGLRINAQDTAGVTQTEDWVKIRGDQLVARDGAYDIRISAELWETHFVDHVSLMVVDHPDDVEIFVDERFVPGALPKLAVHATTAVRPVSRAFDHTGYDVTDIVSRRDGRYLSTFDRGRYQGLAPDHFVEIELGTPVPRDRTAWVVAQGWIYPTDSSINVAVGQSGRVQSRSLSLEAQNAAGSWVTVASDLGFPAGKNKTVLIDLAPVVRAGLADTRRLRLRTNLEIYWDSIGYAEAVDGTRLQTRRLAPDIADLRYRGFSQTTFARDLPETPNYERIANTVPRWRDLAGYYTRFGDVRELLADVEDRYTIMNAGDELRLSFPAPPPPERGWTRDFVLIGDGWVKDGDFNTTFSKTVHPLPAHGVADYESTSAEPTLEQDPVYRRHREDWQTFHTRFVTPQAFVAGLGR